MLVVARAWSADFEWWVHGLVARREGVPEAVIDAIGRGRRPVFEDAACQAAHDVAHELVTRRRLDTSTLARARSVLGERALVEVITLVGFYQLVSGILESFHPPGPSVDLPVVGVPSTAARAGFDLYEAASTTRAVRRLRPDPIPEPVLRRVLEAATWAPSGGNLQPWHVIAVRDPARKNALAALYRELWSAYATQRRALLATALDVGDKVAGVAATGADLLPVYRFLGARLVAEACLKKAVAEADAEEADAVARSAAAVPVKYTRSADDLPDPPERRRGCLGRFFG